jgi:hypothetical protein
LLHHHGLDCLVPISYLTIATADSDISNAVDLYNSATEKWSKSYLSVGRAIYAAQNLGNVTIFAGGSYGALGGVCL